MSEVKVKKEPCAKGSILFFALQVVEAVSLSDMERETNLTWKSMKLANIAKAYAKAGKYDRAFKVVEAQSENLRPEALAEIALAYIRAGEDENAHKTAAMIKDIQDWKSPQGLARIVFAWCEAGKYDQALQAVEKIDDGEDKARALVGIANAYAGLGKKKGVPEILSKALEAAKKIESETYDIYPHPGSDMRIWVYDSEPRLLMLVEIAKAFSSAGYHDRAVEAAGLVKDYAQDHYWKGALPQWEAKILIDVFDRQLEEDQKEKTLELLSQALKAAQSVHAEKVGDSEKKITLFIEVADRYGALGKKDKGLDILAQALKEAESIEGVDIADIRVSIGCSALARIAGKYAELGDSHKALEVLSRALKIVESAELSKSGGAAGDKVKALAQLAAVYAAMDQDKEASTLFSKAAIEAGGIKDACWRAQAMLDIVEIHMQAENYDQAVEEAATLESSMIQSEASGSRDCWVGGGEGYAKLIDGLFEDEKYDEIIKLTGMMQPSWYKMEALTRLADAFAKKGQKDKAAHMIHGALKVVEKKPDGWDRQLLYIANEYSASGEKAGAAVKSVLEKIVKM